MHSDGSDTEDDAEIDHERGGNGDGGNAIEEELHSPASYVTCVVLCVVNDNG
jgi:hypothetical protein